MNSLEIDDDAFYICTELTPRCYVFQKAIQIDRTQIQRVVGDLDKLDRPFDAAPPPAPQLPHWFTAECRNHLVNCGEPAPSAVPTTVLPMSSGPSPVPPLSLADLKYQLKAQLEYYFSRENLITDRYLRCQMDADQYVPIAVIAGFRKIIQLTTDYNLVLEALRESTQVEVDEKGEKVRPLCKRCTIILREIAEEQKTDVEGMLSGGPAFIDLKYGLNNSWYVTYDNEETTQRAYLHLQSLDRPICARIKAGGPPTDLSAVERAPTAAPDPSLMSPELGIPFVPMMTLTDALASFRFVPTATFRPSSTVVHVEEDQKARRGAPRNMTSPRGGGRGGGHNMVLQHKNYTGGVGMQTNGVAGSGYPQMNGIMHQQHNYMGPAQQTQFVDRDRRVNNGRGRGGGIGVSNASGPRRGGGNDKTYHQGGRRNGGGQNRPRREMWNNGMVGQQQQQQQQQSCALPSLSVSTGDLASATAQTSPQMTVERPRYHSYRRERTDDGTSFEQDRNMATGSTGSASGRARRWESESETDRDSNRKTSSVISGGSAYSFEERAFPCLSEPKPEPEKPVQKPTFSSVAAGKRFAKPEPKKSYAEKLKEKGATHL